jgi:hypothetical protein
MGIYGQPNSWQCGPFALKHALLGLGVFAHEDELARLARSDPTRGTDERQLARAARRFRATLPVARRGTVAGARQEIEGWLARGIPVLLCLDQWEHWVTAVAADARHVVLFDSKYDAPLLVTPWDEVAARLVYQERRVTAWTRALYDIHPTVPRWRGFRLRLTPPRARYLLRPDQTTLAARWDDYARHALALAVPTGAQMEIGTPLADFVASRRSAILERAAAHRGGLDDGEAARTLEGIAFAATLYGAVLRPEAQPQAVERLAQAVAWPDAAHAAA